MYELPVNTAELWGLMKDRLELSSFVLIGGTALAMHLHHRVSEDLDLLCMTNHLPNSQIKILKNVFLELGKPFIPNDHIAEIEEFEDTGINLADHSQNFICNGTKLTLFTADSETRLAMDQYEIEDRVGPRVASVDEIFRLKCLVSADRSKSRDWIDLYVLINEHHYGPLDFFDAFVRSNVFSKMDIAFMRLRSGKLDRGDEGFQSLMNSPPSIAELTEFFRDFEDQVHVAAAKRKIGNSPTTSG